MKKPVKKRPAYAVTSVDHALRLATILQVEGPLTVTAAADRLGVAPSTAHRLLSTLVYRDFAVQETDRRYAAGPVLALGVRAQSRVSLIRTVAMPHVEMLVERTHESANLTVLAGDRVRFIGSVESPQVLRVGNREGTVFPAHLTSGGKAMLAESDEATLEKLYSPAAWVDRAEEVPDLDLLRRDLTAVRRNGFALNAGQSEDGVTAVGMALHAEDGSVEAALSVSMPSLRFDRDRLPVLVAQLQRAVSAIEAELPGAEGPGGEDGGGEAPPPAAAPRD